MLHGLESDREGIMIDGHQRDVPKRYAGGSRHVAGNVAVRVSAHTRVRFDKLARLTQRAAYRRGQIAVGEPLGAPCSVIISTWQLCHRPSGRVAGRDGNIGENLAERLLP